MTTHLEDSAGRGGVPRQACALTAVGVAFAAGILAAVLSAQCVRVLRGRADLKEW